MEEALTVNLSSIYGIGKSSLDLLEAAGFHNVESVANADVDALLDELVRANDVLKLSDRNPTRASVDKWIAIARDSLSVDEVITETNGQESSELVPVNYERTPEVVSMLAVAPFALPLPARVLMDHQLSVSDIPAGLLLNRYSGDLDVQVVPRLPGKPQPKVTAASVNGYVQLADNTRQRIEFDPSKFRSIDEMAGPLVRGPAIKVSPAEDRIALLRAPRTATNKGRNPESRFYIRGVLHSHPVSVSVGAFVTILVILMIPLAVASAGLLFLSTEVPEKFGWVPSWLLAFPIALPVSGACYLIWGLSGACRICGQKLFVHRSHLKNSRAHRVPGLGYILPLCFHILVFRWFRCTHCGTPVRLKE